MFLTELARITVICRLGFQLMEDGDSQGAQFLFRLSTIFAYSFDWQERVRGAYNVANSLLRRRGIVCLAKFTPIAACYRLGLVPVDGEPRFARSIISAPPYIDFCIQF